MKMKTSVTHASNEKSVQVVTNRVRTAGKQFTFILHLHAKKKYRKREIEWWK